MPNNVSVRSTGSYPLASAVLRAGAPNESLTTAAKPEAASVVHSRSRHPFEFPPDEWMAVFGAICVLLLAVMIFGSVRKYLLDRKRRALAKKATRWESSTSRKKKSKGKKQGR